VELKGNDATLQERQLLQEYELPDHHDAEWLQRWWLGDR
jgi:hypothetical protein